MHVSIGDEKWESVPLIAGCVRLTEYRGTRFLPLPEANALSKRDREDRQAENEGDLVSRDSPS